MGKTVNRNTRIKRFLYIIDVVLITTLFLLIRNLHFNTAGFYNIFTNTLVCTSEYTCSHEIAHKIDNDNKNPSKSVEFSDALRAYVITNPTSELSNRILYYRGVLGYSEDFALFGRDMWSSPTEELYADIYAWSKTGQIEMPDQLKKFYSEDKVYGDLYSCLIGKGICNKAFRITK